MFPFDNGGRRAGESTVNLRDVGLSWRTLLKVRATRAQTMHTGTSSQMDIRDGHNDDALDAFPVRFHSDNKASGECRIVVTDDVMVSGEKFAVDEKGKSQRHNGESQVNLYSNTDVVCYCFSMAATWRTAA